MVRLLIVDDEPETRDVLGRFFVRRGYDVVEADTGEAALEVVDREKIDAVLLDVRMPGIDGIETLRRMLAGHPNLPVVMVTGEADTNVARAAVDDGAFDYLVKPPDFEYLAQTLFVKLELRIG